MHEQINPLTHGPIDKDSFLCKGRTGDWSYSDNAIHIPFKTFFSTLRHFIKRVHLSNNDKPGGFVKNNDFITSEVSVLKRGYGHIFRNLNF